MSMITFPTHIKQISRSDLDISRGFTLLEMMVSVALFSIVMVTVATAYLNLLNLDRQARATNDVADNLNFVMDTMARSIRTGTNYQCGGPGGTNCWPPVSPSSEFTFTDDQGQVDTYLLNTSTGQIGECYNSASCSTATASYTITDPRIKIDTLNFYVRGAQNNTDQIEPQVTIVLHGTIYIDPTHPPVAFTIQTSATQRQIDI